MREFILGVLASLVASYIVYLCNKIKSHSNSGKSKSGYEFDMRVKFKKIK